MNSCHPPPPSPASFYVGNLIAQLNLELDIFGNPPKMPHISAWSSPILTRPASFERPVSALSNEAGLVEIGVHHTEMRGDAVWVPNLSGLEPWCPMKLSVGGPQLFQFRWSGIRRNQFRGVPLAAETFWVDIPLVCASRRANLSGLLRPKVAVKYVSGFKF